MEASQDALQEGMVPLKNGTASGPDKPTAPDHRPQKNSSTPEHHHQSSLPIGMCHQDLAATITVSSTTKPRG
jgi:hypothetical protein